jgi:hypothetical protein
MRRDPIQLAWMVKEILYREARDIESLFTIRASRMGPYT